MPLYWTEFASLEGLNYPKCLIYAPTHIVITHSHVTDHPLRVNNEGSSIGYTFILFKNTEIRAHLLMEIREEWKINLTKVTRYPSFMRMD